MSESSHLRAADAPRFAQERQQRIAQTLREQGRVEVPALAAQYEVSQDTVRRDLRLLASRGLVQKTHGGAVALHATAMPVSQRSAIMAGSKQAIARAALALLEPHQSLFIDAGTTALALAQLLAAGDVPRPLTVITHALDVAYVLSGDARIRLVLAGGTWAPEVRVFSGPQTVATLQAHRADFAFLGACALHPRAGLTANEAGEALVKRAMVEGAARSVVLTDATKLDAVAPHAVAQLSELSLVISDARPAWLRKHVAVQTI